MGLSKFVSAAMHAVQLERRRWRMGTRFSRFTRSFVLGAAVAALTFGLVSPPADPPSAPVDRPVTCETHNRPTPTLQQTQ